MNTCRWLTVMASGREIHLEDLPQQLKPQPSSKGTNSDWKTALQRWTEQNLAAGTTGLLDDALPTFERIVIKAALTYSGGHRQDTAKLLSWGRNTLTRKIKELGMEGEV